MGKQMKTRRTFAGHLHNPFIQARTSLCMLDSNTTSLHLSTQTPSLACCSRSKAMRILLMASKILLASFCPRCHIPVAILHCMWLLWPKYSSAHPEGDQAQHIPRPKNRKREAFATHPCKKLSFHFRLLYNDCFPCRRI